MMKCLVLSAVLALWPTICLAQGGGSQGDEAAIKRAIGRLRETVEKRDADRRAGLFTEDAVFYNAFGVEREGREAIREFWKMVFATGTFSRSEFKITKEKIRFLRPDVGVVDIRGGNRSAGSRDGQGAAASICATDPHHDEEG